MGYIILLVAILFLLTIVIGQGLRLRAGKVGELWMQAYLKDKSAEIERLDDELRDAFERLRFFDDLFVEAAQQRDDAWMLMGQLLEEDIKDRHTAAHVQMQVGRDGVYYEFRFNNPMLVNETLVESDPTCSREQQSSPVARLSASSSEA